MRRVTTTLSVLLAVLLSVGAAAQVPADWASRLPREAASAVQALVAEADAEGLPSKPLIQKALEGTAKGVAPARIVAAVRNHRATLRDARYIVAGIVPPSAPEPEELEAVAFALHRGLPPAEIRRLLAAASAETREVALQVAADITAYGFSPASASELVADALARRVAPSALIALPRAVTVELQRGLPPAEALIRARARIAGGGAGRVP